MPTAVITGATSGLGLAFAAHLAKTGHDLTLVARTEQDLESAAAGMRHPGLRVTALAADLATAAGSRSLTDSLAENVPDLLVNNAGIALAAAFPTGDPGAEETLLQLNIGCVLRTTRTVLPAMMRRGSGAVINVASVAAYGPTWLASTYYCNGACRRVDGGGRGETVVQFPAALCRQGRHQRVLVRVVPVGSGRGHGRAAGDRAQ